MLKYDIIFEALQDKVANGELTVEDAEILNDLAYEKYFDDNTEYEIEESTRLSREIAKASEDHKKTIEDARNKVKKLQKLTKNAATEKDKKELKKITNKIVSEEGNKISKTAKRLNKLTGGTQANPLYHGRDEVASANKKFKEGIKIGSDVTGPFKALSAMGDEHKAIKKGRIAKQKLKEKMYS